MGQLLGVAVCPHPPLLLRELNGDIDSVPDLRSACHDAVRTLIDWHPDRIVIIGLDSPWSLRVANRLLAESSWHGETEWHPVRPESTTAERAETAAMLTRTSDRIALLVMADGTASRTRKAPGYFDEGAAGVDEMLVRALRDGDYERLAQLDDVLAEELRMQGVPALHVLGAALRSAAPRCVLPTVSYVDDPFGVLYVVATWQLVA
jgi:hypothetical protein